MRGNFFLFIEIVKRLVGITRRLIAVRLWKIAAVFFKFRDAQQNILQDTISA